MIFKINWKLIKKGTIHREETLQWEYKELNIGSTITEVFNLKHKLQTMSTTKVSRCVIILHQIVF